MQTLLPLPKPLPASPASEFANIQTSDLPALATNDAVRDWDLLSGALIWRQNFASLLGYDENRADGKIEFWQKRLHPADRARIGASLQQAFASNAERWSGEYRFRAANGEYLLLFERACLVRDETGRATRFIGSMMDVTARRQMQDQVARSQRMEAFGQLAGGLAHDFNNFLTAILGYSDLIAAEAPPRGAIVKYIAEVRGAAGRAATLTHQLLAFSRRQPLEPRVLEVNTLVNNLERSILRLLGENISVFCDHTPKPVHVKVDPEQFTQIIVNLAVNARDAMPHGGNLQLKIAVTSLAGDPVHPELAVGEYVRISVIDDGIGMTDEVRQRIFEPFFTTKDERHGSGLGLATCYGIIRQSEGHITIESTLGQGTSVHILLPLVAPPISGTHRRPRLDKLPNGHESILVVEDDRSVRHIAVRTLRLLGYDVVEALCAGEAQKVILENPKRFHLVISDIMLPDMSGRAFADWTRERNSRMQLLLISGYLENNQAGEGSDVFFLPKPFDPEQLAHTVRHALDAVS